FVEPGRKKLHTRGRAETGSICRRLVRIRCRFRRNSDKSFWPLPRFSSLTRFSSPLFFPPFSCPVRLATLGSCCNTEWQISETSSSIVCVDSSDRCGQCARTRRKATGEIIAGEGFGLFAGRTVIGRG